MIRKRVRSTPVSTAEPVWHPATMPGPRAAWATGVVVQPALRRTIQIATNAWRRVSRARRTTSAALLGATGVPVSSCHRMHGSRGREPDRDRWTCSCRPDAGDSRSSAIRPRYNQIMTHLLDGPFAEAVGFRQARVTVTPTSSQAASARRVPGAPVRRSAVGRL